MASSKQRAAARRNIKKARAAIRRKTRRSRPKARRSVRRKTSKRSRTRSTHRKRKSSGKTKRRKTSKKRMVGSLGKIPLINNPAVKKIAAGIGLGTLGVAALSFVAPQIAANPIIRPALAFLGGGPLAAVASFFIQGGLGSGGGGGSGGAGAA